MPHPENTEFQVFECRSPPTSSPRATAHVFLDCCTRLLSFVQGRTLCRRGQRRSGTELEDRGGLGHTAMGQTQGPLRPRPGEQRSRRQSERTQQLSGSRSGDFRQEAGRGEVQMTSGKCPQPEMSPQSGKGRMSQGSQSVAPSDLEPGPRPGPSPQ